MECPKLSTLFNVIVVQLTENRTGDSWEHSLNNEDIMLKIKIYNVVLILSKGISS